MQNVKKLKAELKQNKKFLANNFDEMGKHTFNKMVKRNNTLAEIISYLETKPKETFIRAEKNRLERILASKLEQFTYWSNNICPKEIEGRRQRNLFNKELGLTLIRKQINTINFILKS